jgi:pyruvate,orthophosphate dikinase
MRLLIRALRIDGCKARGPATAIAMLEQALATDGISVDQYVNILQFLSQSVENLIRIRFLEPYDAVMSRILRRMLDRGLLPQAKGESVEATILKVSEAFLRDLIAQGFGLQQLDNLVGNTLRALLDNREKLDPPTMNLLMSYDARRTTVEIDGRESPFDGAIHLGNKGFQLKRMAEDGLPVPNGFALTTEIFRCHPAIVACEELGLEYEQDIRREVERLERKVDCRFGDPDRPLLLSVRSSGAISMPGVLDTFLDVGISEEIAEGLATRSGSPWGAWDAYRRFHQCWGMAHGIDRDPFDALMREVKRSAGVAKKAHLPSAQMRELALRYRDLLATRGVEIPEDPYDQLFACIDLSLRSWYADRAQAYRSACQIADEWGTAVIVQGMVYGNLHERSGTGVVLTCDPRVSSASVNLYGDFIVQGQGEDVVSAHLRGHGAARAYPDRRARNVSPGDRVHLRRRRSVGPLRAPDPRHRALPGLRRAGLRSRRRAGERQARHGDRCGRRCARWPRRPHVRRHRAAARALRGRTHHPPAARHRPRRHPPDPSDRRDGDRARRCHQSRRGGGAAAGPHLHRRLPPARGRRAPRSLTARGRGRLYG